MTWKASVLVLASFTARSDELLDALRRRAEAGPVSFSLLLPSADPSQAAHADAEARLATALDRLRGAGLEIDGRVVDPDPIVAVGEEFDPRRYDEVIVSTFPSGASKWLQIDLPHRIARITGAPVKHVVAQPPHELTNISAPPRREESGVLTPLRVLAWGGARRRRGTAPKRESRARS